jgi:hypothetical protein
MKAIYIHRTSESGFYLLHMEYGGSIGFVSRKMKKIISIFYVLGLFMAKKHDLSEQNFFVCHAPGSVAVERKICAKPTA